MTRRLVVVGRPSPSGGRRVRADGEILGLAYDLRDVEEFLRRVGLEDIDVVTSDLIEWRGGGPAVWTVRQVFQDPENDHDWGISATVDLAASDELGAAAVTVTDVGPH